MYNIVNVIKNTVAATLAISVIVGIGLFVGAFAAEHLLSDGLAIYRAILHISVLFVFVPISILFFIGLVYMIYFVIWWAYDCN